MYRFRVTFLTAGQVCEALDLLSDTANLSVRACIDKWSFYILEFDVEDDRKGWIEERLHDCWHERVSVNKID